MIRSIRSLLIAALLIAPLTAADSSCGDDSADGKQRQQQEKILSEGTSVVGMPAIKNFRERRQLREILELRDEEGLATYTYLFSEVTGKTTFFCNSIGYGLPYATQFTSPEKDVYYTTSSTVHMALPQADPNGLFSPSAAEGTWITCLGPDKSQKVVYVEPRVIVSPFKIDG